MFVFKARMGHKVGEDWKNCASCEVRWTVAYDPKVITFETGEGEVSGEIKK